MENDNKLHSIDGKGTPSVSKDAIRQLKNELPNVIEHLKLVSELHWVKYTALIEQGFTKEQALELCKFLF